MSSTPSPPTSLPEHSSTPPEGSLRARLVALHRANKIAAREGQAAAALGWRFVLLHPGLFLWRILARVAEQVLLWGLIGVIFTPFLINIFTESELTPLLGILARQAFSPVYLVGLSGALASMLLITWLMEAWVRAATWIACARRVEVTHATATLEARPSMTWSEAAHHTPHVLLWLVLRKLVMLAAILAGFGIYIGLVYMMGLFGIPDAVKFFLLLFLYMSGFLYLALIFATIEWYPARWIFARMGRQQELIDSPGVGDAGEALLHAARRSLEYPIEIYRLFLHSIRPAIPFLFLSFLAQVGKFFFLDELELYSLLNTLGWLLDLLVLAALTGVTMAFRFGSGVLEGYWEEAIEAPQVIRARLRLQKKLLRQNRHNPLTKLLLSRASNSEHLEAKHLAPHHTPNRFDFEQVLSSGVSQEEDEEHS